jgi:pSer/pThr/pTyr-binding forkhead associated (FHA) protein
MSEESNKPIVLRVYKDGALQTIKQFVQQQIVIGQSADVQLSLSHSSVSVIHAAIESRDAGYFVCDLGSESGTILKGAKVLDAKIESGD